jgi:CheY-like chemotaxis protein
MKNGKYLILFAEDYEDILQSELMMAEMRGWEAIGVTTARGMIEVFNSLCANPSGSCCIDCIVADIQFHHSGNGPRLTGIGAVNSIRQSYPNIPVLYYSGYVNTMTLDLIRAQKSEYVEKASDPRELFDRIETVIKSGHNSGYTGVERRRTSINRHGYRRRVTDKPVIIPPVVEEALQVARTASAGVGPIREESK